MAKRHSSNHKRMQKVMDFGSKTKMVLKGDRNGAFVRTLQKRVDAFLEDAKRLDQAMWVVVDHGNERVYTFLEAAVGGAKTANLEELRHRWGDVLTSAAKLGDDLRNAAKTFRRKAEAAV